MKFVSLEEKGQMQIVARERERTDPCPNELQVVFRDKKGNVVPLFFGLSDLPL